MTQNLSQFSYRVWETLLHQLVAVEGSNTGPIVRLPGLDPVYFKKALDLGAHGVMLPSLNTAEEAAQAVSFSRYPPHGVRGVAGMNRCAHFGQKLEERLETAHENTLVAIQIETKDAVENVDAIAAVEGVDVLFVGPMDLSVSLGIPRQLEHPDYKAACAKVVDAAGRYGKASGLLLLDSKGLSSHLKDGFTFIAVGSDGGMLMQGMNALVKGKQDALEGTHS